MPNNILLPRINEIGAGSIDRAADVLAALGVSRPLIVTDAMMGKLGYVDRLSQRLHHAGIAFGVFDETVPEPTEVSIKAGVAALT